MMDLKKDLKSSFRPYFIEIEWLMEGEGKKRVGFNDDN